MKTIKVLKPNSFCLEKHTRVLGIADGGTFASMGWTISDEAYNKMWGEKFSWIAKNGERFVDHKDNFIRPAEDQIIGLMTRELQDKALELGLIEIESTGNPSNKNHDDKDKT